VLDLRPPPGAPRGVRSPYRYVRSESRRCALVGAVRVPLHARPRARRERAAQAARAGHAPRSKNWVLGALAFNGRAGNRVEQAEF
jgi:hypothetical protein